MLPRSIAVIMLTAVAIAVTGCGIKGPLRLPPGKTAPEPTGLPPGTVPPQTLPPKTPDTTPTPDVPTEKDDTK